MPLKASRPLTHTLKRQNGSRRRLFLGGVMALVMISAATLLVSLFFLDTRVPPNDVEGEGALEPLIQRVKTSEVASVLVEMVKPTRRRVKLTPYDGLIEAAATRHGVPPNLIQAVIHSESGFDSKAVSPVGAQGLMQLMPATAQQMKVIDSFDARQNIEGGTRYLRWLSNQFGRDWVKVVAAYNAGPENVRRYGGAVPPFPETQTYVRRVMKMFRQYKDRSSVEDTAFALTWPADSELVVPVKNAATTEALEIRIQGSSPIRAASEGKVIQINGDAASGWSVRISHDARYQTTYAPLSRVDVEEGREVVAGQMLGSIDARDGEARLHFEVLENNQPRDPLDYRWKRIGAQTRR